MEPADSDVAPLQERTPHAEASWRERAEEVFSPASMCKSEFCETVRRSSLGLGAAQPAQAAPDPDMYSCTPPRLGFGLALSLPPTCACAVA